MTSAIAGAVAAGMVGGAGTLVERVNDGVVLCARGYGSGADDDAVFLVFVLLIVPAFLSRGGVSGTGWRRVWRGLAAMLATSIGLVGVGLVATMGCGDLAATLAAAHHVSPAVALGPWTAGAGLSWWNALRRT